jgi:hypothetical protein
MLLWAFLPVLAVYQSSMLFQIPFLAAMAVWILSGLSQMSPISRKKCLLFMIPYMLLMYFYVFIGYGNLNIPTSFDYALLLGFIVNCIYYIERPDIRFDKRVLIIALLLITITALTTLSVLLVDGNASRTLTSSSSNPTLINRYKQLNVGSYDFIYGLVVIIPMLAFYSLSQKKIKFSLLIWSLVALFIVVVVMSNFTTAQMLLFVDFVFVILARKRFKTNSGFVVSFIVLTVLASFMLPFLLNYMIIISDSIYAQSKLEGILGVLSGTESYDETTSRSELLKMSLKSFLDSPIWGIGAWYGSGSPHVGQHAQFVDDIARYGLLGFIPLMVFVYYSMKKIYLAFKEKHFYNRRVLVSILIFVALGFMNPIYNPGLLACMFMVVPMLDRYCYEQNENTIRH